MSFWTVVSNLSVITTLGQALESAVQKNQQIFKINQRRMDDIIDYTVIAQDLHWAAEKVDQYITQYHANYIGGHVLTQEEKESFLDGFFDAYPKLRSYRSQVIPYLHKYLERMDDILCKELTFSERVLLCHEADHNRLLHQIIDMVSEILDEQRKARPQESYNANLMYAESFCQTLFLHKDQPESKVNLQNLFVMQNHSIAGEYGTFVRAGCSLDQEIEHFLSGEKTALFIQGDAGSGKSTLVSWMNYHDCFRDEISKRLFKNRPVVTVRLRDLDRSKIGDNRMMNAILAYLKVCTLDDLAENYPSAIMILDGFDELCMIEGLVDYEYLIGDIFRKNLPGFQFIITTRPKYLDVHKVDVDYTYIHLEHFDREQRVQWLENYIHVCGEQVSDFIEDYIRNLADWDDSGCMENSDDAAVCDTPMTLYMIAAKRISRDSLTNHWALYRQIFFQELSDTEYNKMFPNREWRYEHPIHRYKDLLYRISEEIAYEMYRTGNRTLQLSDVQIRQIISNILDCRMTDEEISAISDRCYALCTYWKADTRKGFVEFYHNNIRDFFLCERIYRRLNEMYRKMDTCLSAENSGISFAMSSGDVVAFSNMLGNDLCENYSHAALETKVCQFIYERSLYENTHFSEIREASFPVLENKLTIFPLVFQNMLSFRMRYCIVPRENNIQILSNIFTCAAQIFRYAAEPFLRTVDETSPDEEEVLFRWWFEVADVNAVGTLKYLFRSIYRQVPVTYDDGTMISMSSKSNFSGLNLSDCDLREIDFRYSNLAYAVFSNTVLDRCDFRDTKREYVDFTNISDKDAAW